MDLPKTIPGLVLLMLILVPFAVRWWPWWLSDLLIMVMVAGAVWVLVRDHL